MFEMREFYFKLGPCTFHAAKALPGSIITLKKIVHPTCAKFCLQRDRSFYGEFD